MKVNCYYRNKDFPKIKFPIFYAIKLEDYIKTRQCFGFICNIYIDKDYSFKVLILKRESKDVLTESDFNNKRFSLIYKSKEKPYESIFNPRKRKFYFNSILNIAFIEINKGEEIGVDYIYSDNVKSEYKKLNYFIKLNSKTREIKKFECTIHDYNDNFIYTSLSQNPLIGNPILICEENEKIKNIRDSCWK